MLADFRREYAITPDQIATLGAREFMSLLQGLSPEAMFRKAVEQEPEPLDEDKAADVLAKL